MLILVSHGETQQEVDKIFSGRSDSKLTDRGIRQVEDCAETLKSYDLDMIYYSPDLASSRTAGIVSEYNSSRFSMSETELLYGRSGGNYEGIEYKELRTILSPRRYRLWERDIFEYPDMGESYKDIASRVIPFIKYEISDLIKMNKTVLIVSSIEVLRVIVCYVRGGDETDIPTTRIEHAIPYFYSDLI